MSAVSRSFYRVLPLLGVALVSASIIGRLQLPQLQKLQQHRATPSLEALKREEEREKIRLAFLQKMPAFGFDNLLADWTFLQVVQYFGDDDARAIAGYGLTLDYFELILDRDPRFLEAYMLLSTAGSLYAAQPRESDRLMEQGLAVLTPTIPHRSYLIWRYKAVNELLFLDPARSQAQQSFAKAAEWASVYSDEESQRAVQSSRQTAQFLAKNPQSRVAKVTAWQMILKTVPDERARQRAVREIEKLGGTVVLTPEGEIRGIIPPAED